MHKVRKHEKKKFPRWGWLIIIISLTITTTFIYLLERKVEPPKIETKSERIDLLRLPVSDIASLTVYPTGGEKYTIVQKKQGQYHLESNPDYPLQAKTLDEMFDAVSSMVADSMVIKNIPETQLQEFGVNEESLRFTITDKNKESSTWYFGYELNTEVPMRYLYQQGGSMYLTGINYPDICNFTVQELHPVPSINFTPDIITGIQVVQGNHALRLIDENGMWFLTAPFKYPADKQAVDGLLQKIGDMRLAAFVEDASDQALTRYGFDMPRATITLNIADSTISVLSPEQQVVQQDRIAAHSNTFVIGNPIEGIGFYCLYEDMVFKATNLSMGFFMDMYAEDYTLKNPFNISLNVMKSMKLQRNGETTDYQFIIVEQILQNNEIATDEFGNTLFDMHVEKNGAPIETSSFIADYTNLNHVRVDGILDDSKKINQENPLLLAELEYETGRRTIAFYPYDALHAAVSIDGIICHYIEIEKISNILL